jgi:hypothetical protein
MMHRTGLFEEISQKHIYQRDMALDAICDGWVRREGRSVQPVPELAAQKQNK